MKPKEPIEEDEDVVGVVAQAPSLRKRINVQKGEGLWLMSFSDMSLILMSFFILQLAFSTPDKRRYESVAEAMQKDKPQQNFKAIEEQISSVIREKNLDKLATIKSSVHGLALELKDQIVFDSGSATLSSKHNQIIASVMDIVAKTPKRYKIVIEGHTDDLPVKKGPYSSNWNLAAARGISLLQDFKARGVPEDRISVIAYAQTRPKIPFKGLNGEALHEARAANRRVVIRIE